MKIKQKKRRFLSFLLAFLLVLNIPFSVLASEEWTFLEATEEVEVADETEIFSEEIYLSEEERSEETIEQTLPETLEEVSMETEETILGSSMGDGFENSLFADGNVEQEKNIELVDGEVLTEELFSDGEYEAEKISDGTYQVTVKVAPKEADVTFYYDSSATIEMQENVYDEGIVDGYHQYTLIAEEGTYAYRATEGEQILGGMEFKVPIADEYASDGTLMGKGQVLSLKRVNFYTTNADITKVEDYTLHLYPQDLCEVVNGSNYISEENYVTAPIMVNAGGNALTYQCFIDINGELGNTYAVEPLQNITFTPGSSTEIRAFNVSKVKWYTLTAPAEAKAQMFRQSNNYNVIEIPVSRTETLEDGTVKSYFATPGGQTITYRVSMDNKITRAGYTSTSERDLVFKFADYENPKSTKTTAQRIENSSVLNINTQNNLKLSVGETFRLRAFRAGWQIINTDPGNIMIEPDFHYNIISGAEHIRMNPVTDKTTGNAGSGMNSNWMDITAISEGTVVLEVSYDAIQIDGETGYPGIYGAVDPERKSVVVINIGESTGGNSLSVIPTQGNYAKYIWDADFDTIYFTEETADFKFKATIGGGTPDRVELSTNLGRSWTEVNKIDDNYAANGLVEGNNILRVTKGSHVEYQVVRAARLNVSIANMTRGGEALIAGDEIRVVFKGIYTPVPKMSGIYNPGWVAAHKTIYTVPEGVTATSTSTQYGFAADNQLDITFTEPGVFTFTNGYITSDVMGDALGQHRLLTDSGRGVNMNARNASSNRCIMPDLTFEVCGLLWVDVTMVSNPEGAIIEVTNINDEIIERSEDGTYKLEYGTYHYKAVMNGYVPETGKFIVGGDDNISGKKTVTIEMRAIGGVIWNGTDKAEPKKNDEGAYLIGTGAELAWFATNHGNTNAILTADISLGGFSVNIKNYAGVFDGNGHYINDYYGSHSLFTFIVAGAVVRNLGITGEVLSTEKYFGAGGIIQHCSNGGNITVENCVSRVKVTGNMGATGGIVGQGYSGGSSDKIINCYNTGSVKATSGGNVAGIIGYKDSSPVTNVENCYNIGEIKGYGIARYTRGTDKNNYYLLGSASNTNLAAGTALSAQLLKTYASELGSAYLDNPTSYNDGYPILTWEEPRALVVAVQEFSSELDTYKNMDDYRDTQKEELEDAIINGKKEIAEANTLKEAKKAFESVKAVMDAIKTDEELPPGVEVYFSVSHDDKFLKAKNGEVMALKKLTVPYFDLALYGLEKYYFVSESYTEDDKGNLGQATNYEGKVTMLHAFIFATEIYHCGLEPEDAGKGYLYEQNLIGTHAFSPTQAAGSMYLKHFWGMDENFNYYLNYEYPLASAGWGSTADQILLKHGDIITLGHFTSWNFHNDELSVFNYIKVGNKTIRTTAKQGEVIEATVMLAAKGGNYTTAHLPMANKKVYITEISSITENPRQWNQVGTSDENGIVRIATRNLEPGQYLVATPGAYGVEYTNEICSTPGGILLTIKDNSEFMNKVVEFENLVTNIPSLDEMILSNAETVKRARDIYESLTDTQKAVVYEEILWYLVEAEAKIAELTHVHSWENGTVTKEPTCKKTGVMTYICACGESKTETIAKTSEHHYGEWEVVSAATVSKAEVQKHTCSVCGKSETKSVGKVLKAVLELPGEIKGIYLKEGNSVTFTIRMANGDKISSVVSNNSNILKIGAVAKKTGAIRMKGMKSGIAKLKITLASGKTRNYTVKVVSGQVKTKQLTIPNVTDKKLTLKKDKTFALEAVKVPFTSTQKVTYASSDKNVATVTSAGKIKAVGVGTAVITVASGSKKVKITVTVPGITNVKSSVSVNKNKTLTLKPTTYGINGKVTYTSSDTNIVTVTSKGKLKGIKKGTATVTIQAGNYKKTVKVTVK